MSALHVLICTPVPALLPALDQLPAGQLAAVDTVGPRPGKEIDPLLSGRVLVVGDDADLAAVVLRLFRKDRLGTVELAYATAQPTPFSRMYSLPVGAAALRVALQGEPDPVPLVRNDVGGVLIAEGYLSPVHGTAYVDEFRVLSGATPGLLVQPHPEKGLEVTVRRTRILGFGRKGRSHLGRALQVGSAQSPMTVLSDGVRFDRPMDRWTFYRHTAPLRLVRGAF
ncbi:hypothetical protein GIS00_19060 [Nakamurella sp. YIM 132087]|uniref:Uncharacterized protein n=1 Tax=Nakamurella alba TaxID=2665158 RepID=A0A7K1FPN4_9ACTN|nr:hypothetical protein [Nakamurella alba]MTD16040.1 hypothetical protein [Nakamurella alba]